MCILSGLSGWHIALIVVGVIALTVAVALTISAIAVSCSKGLGELPRVGLSCSEFDFWVGRKCCHLSLTTCIVTYNNMHCHLQHALLLYLASPPPPPPPPPAVKWKWWRHYCIPISLIVISSLLLLTAIPVWIALGVVVSNPPNDCK